ncbi:MAG: sodium/solute symporter [Sedimentisphaerales bacterium]|nr:sodium/solute symporter [Sedimentisphaerales bacterium]
MNYIIAQTGTISGLDWGIVGIGTLGLFVISYIFGREERDTNDFFLGGRRVPPVVACLSFLATEISALTIVGIPHTAYTENWRWLQFLVGLALARVAVAFLFIPAFYKYNCTSIYEFLGHRFGSASQYAGSIYFFITRLLASGVRLYATCMAVGIIMDWPLSATITLFTLVSIAFIAFGGIKAVVWAGAYQSVFFVVAGVVIVGYLIQHIDGGFVAAMQTANKEELLSTFYFKFDLKDASTFWAFLISGFFIGLVSFGTDQEMVQRLLTVETRKSSQKTIISTIFTVLPVYWLYLLVGTLLFVFYQQNSSMPLPEELKEILPHFARNVLPNGLKGLVLGAIFMASVDSPLSSLSSSFVTDIYRPLIRKHATERHYLFVSRTAVVGFGLVLAGIAAACAPVENILWFAFQILSITGGPMLGAFLLGLLTKRKANHANVLAMLLSTGVCVVLLILIKQEKLNLAWSWLIVIGTGITFVLGYLLGPVMIKTKDTQVLT